MQAFMGICGLADEVHDDGAGRVLFAHDISRVLAVVDSDRAEVFGGLCWVFHSAAAGHGAFDQLLIAESMAGEQNKMSARISIRKVPA
jgi:hypothetical protein